MKFDIGSKYPRFMVEKPQHKVCFMIDAETDERVKDLPRSFNLSEKLRLELIKILDNL